MPNTVYLEHAAKEAGYVLPVEKAEQALRRALKFAAGDSEGRNQLRIAIRAMTHGADFSDLEIDCFLEGHTIKDILAVRIANLGDIQRAHVRAAKPTEPGHAETDREQAYCPSCRRTRPIVFGYVNRPTSAATLDLGGPIGIARINSETDEETYCATCGHRVITDEEADELERLEKEHSANWTFVAILAVLAVGAILAMMASVS